MLGLVFKKLAKIDDALDCFHKLQVITPNNPEVLYQLADLYLFISFFSHPFDQIDSTVLVQTEIFSQGFASLVKISFQSKMKTL